MRQGEETVCSEAVVELLCWKVHGAKERSRVEKQESQVRSRKSDLGSLCLVSRAKA